MPRMSPYQIMLTAPERETLQSWAGQYTLPYYRVMRAKMILLAADGVSNDQIAAQLDVPRKTVSQWRKRFYQDRLAGLEDQPRSGRPPDFSPSGRRQGESLGL